MPPPEPTPFQTRTPCKQTKLWTSELQGNQPVRTHTEQLMIPTSCPCSCLWLSPRRARLYMQPGIAALHPQMPAACFPQDQDHQERLGKGSNPQSVITWFRDAHPVDLISTSTPTQTCHHPPHSSILRVPCAGSCTLLDLKLF